MREIKFRAWDNENHEMIYQSDNTTKQNGIMEAQFTFDDMGVSVFTRNYGSTAWNEIKSFELMQFTGLKDKNGIDVYQHDIPDGIWSGLYIDWCPKCCSFELFDRDCGCGWCLREVSWEDFVDEIQNGLVETITNIHDHPELLTIHDQKAEVEG